MRPLVAPYCEKLVPYVPGKPIEETEREYGVKNIAKLASNENCLGPSPLALKAIEKSLAKTHLYPDAEGFYLKQKLAQLHGVETRQIVLGNGTNEIIDLLAHAILDVNDKLLNAWPSFICYRIAARRMGRDEISVPLLPDLGYDLDLLADVAKRDSSAKLVFIANPNNPTGRGFPAADLDAFMAAVPSDLVVVLDEAYCDYVPSSFAYENGVAWVKKRPRTVVMRTFSKIHGLASVRIGYAICEPALADVLNRLRAAFNTSAIAQAAALAALDDVDHVAKSKAHNAKELPRMTIELEKRGFVVTPSLGNFVLARVGGALPDVPSVNTELLRRGVIARPVANYELKHSLRISVGTVEENDKLYAALDDILSVNKRKPAAKVTAPAAQVEGLVVALDGPAGAGKSTVAKMVAERAGLALVDTGAIYRSVALLALRKGVSVDDAESLAKIAADLSSSLSFSFSSGMNRVKIAGEDVSDAIRTPEVSAGASSVSRHPQVRAALLELQRSLGGRAPGAVLEGRDIGTVVFPDAKVKAFVTASPEERARRRLKELVEQRKVDATYEDVLADIIARDKQDSERPVAPLKPAPDATIVDTTGKTLDAVVAEILALIQKAR